jgi:hypothetical protein
MEDDSEEPMVGMQMRFVWCEELSLGQDIVLNSRSWQGKSIVEEAPIGATRGAHQVFYLL